MRPGRASVSGHWPRVAIPRRGFVAVVHDDYRDAYPAPGCPGSAHRCESIYVDLSCDEGLTWLSQEARLDTDAPPTGTHSEEPAVSVSPAGRIHVFWRDDADPGAEPMLRHAALEVAGPPPTVTVMRDPPKPCAHGAARLSVDAARLGACRSVSFQWYRDGERVPGGTDPDLDVSGDLPEGTYWFHCSAACEDPAGCVTTSEAVEHVVAPLPSPVRGASIRGLLHVVKERSGVRIDWIDNGPDATAYGVYEGSIASLRSARAYDHATVECGLPRVPGATDLFLHVDPRSAAAYFLVAPVDCRAEGLVGNDSFGRARPIAGSGSPCGPASP